MSRPVLLAALPVALVALVAGTVSYSHIVSLGLRTGQSPADAHLLPLAVDGLIAAGSVVVLGGERLGWLAVVPGIVATLFANVESGIGYGPLAATVAAWPAVAFSLASYVLERWLKSQVANGSTVELISQPEPESVPRSTDSPEPVPAAVPAALNGWAAAPTGGWS